MKKLIIALFAAVCCFTSCLVESESDCVYHIGFTIVSGSSEYGDPTSDAATFVKDFKKALSEMTAKYTDEWVVTVRNNKYGSSDSKAKAEYEANLSDIKSFFDTWNKKYADRTDKSYKYETHYKYMVYRVSESGTDYLEEKTFDVDFQ